MVVSITTPFNSLIWPVQKRDVSWRMTVDYCKLIRPAGLLRDLRAGGQRRVSPKAGAAHAGDGLGSAGGRVCVLGGGRGAALSSHVSLAVTSLQWWTTAAGCRAWGPSCFTRCEALAAPAGLQRPPPRDPRPSDCLLSWCLAGHPETDNRDPAARDRQPHSLEGSARAGRG